MSASSLREQLARLQQLADVERQARDQVDAATSLAWEFGATDRQIAKAIGISFDAARMRRRRAGLRGDDPRRRTIRRPGTTRSIG